MTDPDTVESFDCDELLRWAEMYGHPEGWAKRAQDAHARAERAEAERDRLRGIAETWRRELHDLKEARNAGDSRVQLTEEERKALLQGTERAVLMMEGIPEYQNHPLVAACRKLSTPERSGG